MFKNLFNLEIILPFVKFLFSGCPSQLPFSDERSSSFARVANESSNAFCDVSTRIFETFSMIVLFTYVTHDGLTTTLPVTLANIGNNEQITDLCALAHFYLLLELSKNF